MSRKKIVPSRSVARAATWMFTAAAGTAATLVVINLATPTPSPTATSIPPAATSAAVEPTSLPSPTPAPTATLEPSPTATATPGLSIYGRWVIDPGTVTALFNNPPPGEMCVPDASFWPPELILRDTGDPALVIVEGLHEHIASQQLALDLDAMRIVDTHTMVEINQSLLLTLQLQPDDRLYVEEQDLLAGELYCQVYAYYVRAGE
ncbi:MAG: hypothetical protein JXB85_17090 [Anaerolineales bacterium]|nr:hypothetical protein [Anaerolineales bacterium]